MADVNFGSAHGIEFWYITRHGFSHKSENKHHEKKEEKKDHQKQEQHAQKPKDNKKEKQAQHENKNENKKEHATKEAPKAHYTTPNFGHANGLLYWWILKHEASAQREFHHRAAHGEHSHSHDQHAEHPKPAAPKGDAKNAKKGDNKAAGKPAAATSREVPAAAAPAEASAANGAAKKKKKKPAKKELKEPTGELQTATTPEQVRDFLGKNQNFTIADSVTDLGDSSTKLPHTQALHLAKVLANCSAPLVTLNLTGSNLQAAGATALQPFLAKTSTVKKIDVTDCSLHDDGAAAFIVGLAKNVQSKVEALNFSNNKLTAKSLVHIGALVGNSSTFVRSLTLDGNDLGGSEDAIKHFLMSISRPIEHLSLRGVKLTPEAGLLFGTWLSKRPPIRNLVLADNQLGDRAAISIVSEAAVNPSLSSMDLSKNGIGNKAYEEFTRLFLKRAIAPSSIDFSDNAMGRLNESKLKTLLKKNHETQQQIQAREARQKN